MEAAKEGVWKPRGQNPPVNLERLTRLRVCDFQFSYGKFCGTIRLSTFVEMFKQNSNIWH